MQKYANKRLFANDYDFQNWKDLYDYDIGFIEHIENACFLLYIGASELPNRISLGNRIG